MSNIPDTAKQAGDAVAGLAPPSLLIAQVYGWLQFASVLLTCMSAALSIAWFIKRFRDARKAERTS